MKRGFNPMDESYIGRKVKKLSGKPFKSTLKVNTVKDLIINSHTQKIAFTFVEDDSIVECFRCELT